MSEELVQSGDHNTPISAEELDGLIPNLATKQELNEWERDNILSARTWALKDRNLKRCEPVTEAFIRDLHKRMFGKTWKWAGQYRRTEKNIGISAFKIPESLACLIGDAKYWIEEKWDVDEIAIRFHHRLVSIHPFPNGNGRHARLHADIVAVKLGHDAYTWGRKDLVAAGSTRTQYIAALKAADAGNLAPLIEFSRS